MPFVLTALRRLRLSVLIHRRVLIAACAAVVIGVLVTSLRPPAPERTTLWTAVRDLPSGTVLGRDALRATTVPLDLVPQARHDLAALLGRTLATPVGAGEVATSTHLLGNEQLAGYPGRSALPLRIPDAEAVALLHAGDRVDLVASDPQQPQRGSRIARDAIVLALPQPIGRGSAPGLDGRLVVFAVPTAEVVGVAAAASGLFLTPIWNR